MSRRVARETAVKTLFQREFHDISPEEALPLALEDAAELTENDLIFAHQLIDGVIAHQSQLDDTLNEFAVDWKMDRIAKLERSILRFALFELMFMDDVPVGVTVNEAIEITKIYSTQEASRFINGILGNVIQHMQVLQNKPGEETKPDGAENE
ncbi:MAG: transcription antitermination factor NusB [Negativicutes bacterium]|nr:transcription antitermination factor NusB [Negativicutes bacterium]